MPDRQGAIELELRRAESKLNACALSYTNEVAIADWLKAWIDMLSKQSMSADEEHEFFAAFHNSAGRLNVSSIDSDYGALLLEAAAENHHLTHMRDHLLKQALWRASWFAQAATAGGEGLARSAHVKRIEDTLRQ